MVRTTYQTCRYSLKSKSVADLVTNGSMCALKSVKFEVDFIFHYDPSEWKDVPEYTTAKNYIDNLKVVNDVAERFANI